MGPHRLTRARARLASERTATNAAQREAFERYERIRAEVLAEQDRQARGLMADFVAVVVAERVRSEQLYMGPVKGAAGSVWKSGWTVWRARPQPYGQAEGDPGPIVVLDSGHVLQRISGWRPDMGVEWYGDYCRRGAEYSQGELPFMVRQGRPIPGRREDWSKLSKAEMAARSEQTTQLWTDTLAAFLELQQ
jgi:hypothetical protein